MKIISLGGIGGCDLATALRKLNQQTYPYLKNKLQILNF